MSRSAFLPTRVTLVVLYAMVLILAVTGAFRVSPRAPSAVWFRAFFILVGIGSVFRGTHNIVNVVASAARSNILHSVLYILYTAPAFVFFSAYVILLYLWGEQWAIFNRLSKGSFKYLFWGVNGAFYLIVISLLVCEVGVDEVVLSSFDVVDDEQNVFQIILSWIIISMYVGISIGFLAWGYIQFRRANSSQQPLLPAAPAGPADPLAPTHKSLVSSVIWAPHSRLKRLGTLASACMILFLVRTFVLILDVK